MFTDFNSFDFLAETSFDVIETEFSYYIEIFF